jgi:hypothetical protein
MSPINAAKEKLDDYSTTRDLLADVCNRLARARTELRDAHATLTSEQADQPVSATGEIKRTPAVKTVAGLREQIELLEARATGLRDRLAQLQTDLANLASSARNDTNEWVRVEVARVKEQYRTAALAFRTDMLRAAASLEALDAHEQARTIRETVLCAFGSLVPIARVGHNAITDLPADEAEPIRRLRQRRVEELELIAGAERVAKTRDEAA